MSPAETTERAGEKAKQHLRERMKVALSSVSARQARYAGDQIAEALESTPEWRRASRVALFSSLPGEVDTGPIWDAARRASKSALFPRVMSGRQLEFASVEDARQFQAGRFNLLEPDQDCPVWPLDKHTLVLVPGLAFDRQGGRLGRGAGYYDRALSHASKSAGEGGADRPHRFGIGFELQIVSSVPMERYDVRMDGIWTEAHLADDKRSRADTAKSKRLKEETDPE
jgi:5-formyltetrahydrofolate cyclo-ligase